MYIDLHQINCCIYIAVPHFWWIYFYVMISRIFSKCLESTITSSIFINISSTNNSDSQSIDCIRIIQELRVRSRQLSPIYRVTGLESLGWGPRICISTKSQVDDAGPQTPLCKSLTQKNLSHLNRSIHPRILSHIHIVYGLHGLGIDSSH